MQFDFQYGTIEAYQGEIMEIVNRTDYLVDTLRGLDKELQSLEASVVEQAI